MTAEGEAGVGVLAAPRSSAPAKPTILIVDDAVPLRETLGELLSHQGFAVEQAGDGLEALSKYDPSRTDLVLLDLNLPVKNGWETFQRLTTLNPAQAVILISGEVPLARLTALDRDPAIFLEKPIDLQRLLQSIEKVLGDSNLSRAERLAIQSAFVQVTKPFPRIATATDFYFHGGINE